MEEHYIIAIRFLKILKTLLRDLGRDVRIEKFDFGYTVEGIPLFVSDNGLSIKENADYILIKLDIPLTFWAEYGSAVIARKEDVDHMRNKQKFGALYYWYEYRKHIILQP